MNLKTFKNHLQNLEQIKFKLYDGREVPAHFHITELGIVDKRFVDCGGNTRGERKISLQLWIAGDLQHRLLPNKIIQIIDVVEDKLGSLNDEIEVEYQGVATVEKFGLDLQGDTFILTKTNTECLAQDACGVDQSKSNCC